MVFFAENRIEKNRSKGESCVIYFLQKVPLAIHNGLTS